MGNRGKSIYIRKVRRVLKMPRESESAEEGGCGPGSAGRPAAGARGPRI